MSNKNYQKSYRSFDEHLVLKDLNVTTNKKTPPSPPSTPFLKQSCPKKKMLCWVFETYHTKSNQEANCEGKEKDLQSKKPKKNIYIYKLEHFV